MDSVLWVNRNQTILIVIIFVNDTYTFLSDTYLSSLVISVRATIAYLCDNLEPAGKIDCWFRKITWYNFRKNSDELRID